MNDKGKEVCSQIFGEGIGHLTSTARGFSSCREPASMRRVAYKKEFAVWQNPRIKQEFLLTSEGFFYGAILNRAQGIIRGAVWNSKEFVGLEYTWSDPWFANWKRVKSGVFFWFLRRVKDRIDDQTKWEWRKANVSQCRCWHLPFEGRLELKRIRQ